MLYKKPNDVKISVDISQIDGKIILDFSSDCGKFGTDESIAGYILTPERLLQILQEREDLSDDEY